MQIIDEGCSEYIYSSVTVLDTLGHLMHCVQFRLFEEH